MAGTLIDLVRARLGGLTVTNHSPIKWIQDLGGVSTLHRGLGGWLQFKQTSRRVITHSPKGSGATVGTNSTGVPTSIANKKTKTTETALKGSPPRPRIQSASYEARSTGRLNRAPSRTARYLDGAPTRARLVRPLGKTPTHVSLGRAPRLLLFTYPRTKAITFNAVTYYHLPAWLRPGSTCQISLFYRPSRDGRWKPPLYPPYRALFTIDHPRGRIRQGPFSAISGIRPYPSGLDPASTQPRRSAQFNGKGRTVWHGASDHFAVLSPMMPWCPGLAGHSQSTSLRSAQQESTKHHLKAPCRLGLLSPYKRAGQGSTTGRDNEGQRGKTKKNKRQQADRYLKQSPLSSFSSLWDLGSTPSLACL
jgi:hypothetical protein